MAVETLAIVERLVKLDVLRQRRLPKIVDVKMAQAAELRFERAKHGVVRVAGIASLVGRYAMILVVRRGKICRVIDVQALSVGLHDVAREAERGAFGALHFIFHAGHNGKERKKEKHAERKNFSGAAHRDRGTHNYNAREHRAE